MVTEYRNILQPKVELYHLTTATHSYDSTNTVTSIHEPPCVLLAGTWHNWLECIHEPLCVLRAGTWHNWLECIHEPLCVLRAGTWHNWSVNYHVKSKGVEPINQ